jgi:hypothetical protein
MRRWFTRRHAPTDLQLSAQVAGLLVRQDILARQEAAILDALARIEAAALAAAQAAATVHEAALIQATEAVQDLRVRMNGHRPVTPGLAGD